MNSFAIPSHMTLGDFVERAGRAMFKDEWLGAASVTAETDIRQEVHASRRRRPQYDQVLAHVRTALCVGEISAGHLELLTGRIVPINADFWRSPLAETVFMSGTPWIVPEPDPMEPVLLVTSEAEAWLASLDHPEPEDPELRATAWFQVEGRGGKKRCTKGEYCAEMVRKFRITDRAAKRIWEREAPESWKNRGRPKKAKSVH